MARVSERISGIIARESEDLETIEQTGTGERGSVTVGKVVVYTLYIHGKDFPLSQHYLNLS